MSGRAYPLLSLKRGTAIVFTPSGGLFPLKPYPHEKKRTANDKTNILFTVFRIF
jgi:hypothetical protein